MNEKDDNDTPATAVALRYDGKRAPVVTAIGHGLVAEEILRLAEEHDVPLYEDIELAGVLASMDLYQEIPVELYLAVARVIAFAYQLSGKEISAG